MESIYEYKATKRGGDIFDFSELKSKVVIIVNTATGCGFTPQYEGLENLYKKYHDKGLEIIDFPCNQFGHQAPGDDNEIHQFCTTKYNTSFDQFSKIEVNGKNESKLYKLLKEKQSKEKPVGLKNKMAMKTIKAISKTREKEGDIIRNFTKFLVDKNGNIIKRYDPTFKPEEMEDDILKLLNE